MLSGWTGESSGGSYLARDDTSLMGRSLVLVLGDECDGGCGAGRVMGYCTSGIEISSVFALLRLMCVA